MTSSRSNCIVSMPFPSNQVCSASIGVVLLDLDSAPRMCWLTQGGVGEFPTFADLIATATK